MSIRAKIFMSFGAILLLVALAGIVAWSGLSGFVREVEGTGAVSSLADGLDTVSLRITRFRAGQEDEAALVTMGEQLGELAGTSQSLSDEADGEEGRTALLSVVEAITAYQGALSTFREMEINKRTSEEEMLARIAHFEASAVKLSKAANIIYSELQNKLVAVQSKQNTQIKISLLAEKLNRYLFEARLYEAAYRVSGSKTDSDLANKAVRNMFVQAVRLKRLTVGTEQDEPIAKLAGSVNGYRMAFGKLVEAGGASPELIENLTNMSTSTNASAEAIAKAMRKAGKKIGEESDVIEKQFETVINARIAAMELVSLVRKVQISQVDFIRRGGGEDTEETISEALKRVSLVGIKMKKAFKGTEHAATVGTLVGLTKDYSKAFSSYVNAVKAQTEALASMQMQRGAATTLLKEAEQSRLANMNQSAAITKTSSQLRRSRP